MRATKKKKPGYSGPPRDTQFMSSYLVCPNGHRVARMTRTADDKGWYNEAWCTEPGCTARQRVYDQDRTSV